MANHHAISATGKAILGLLAANCPKPEFEGAEFKLCQPSELQPPGNPKFGISLCLFRIIFNASRRTPPGRPTAGGVRQAPPTILDLHFLLTAWAESAEKQLDLLGWAIRVLDENPILPANQLRQFAGSTSADFQPDESVQILGENLSLQEMEAVCRLVEITQQPSTVYIARGIAIQPQTVPTEAPTVVPRLGETNPPAITPIRQTKLPRRPKV